MPCFMLAECWCFRHYSFYNIDIPQRLCIQKIEKNAGVIYYVLSTILWPHWFRWKIEIQLEETEHEREKWNSLKWVWWLSLVKLVSSWWDSFPDLTSLCSVFIFCHSVKWIPTVLEIRQAGLQAESSTLIGRHLSRYCLVIGYKTYWLMSSTTVQ